MADAVRPDHVVVLSDRSSLIGGAEALALLSAEMMAEAGCRVTFIAGDGAAECPLDRTKIDVMALDGTPLTDAAPRGRAFTGIYNKAARTLLSDFISRTDTPRTIYHLHNWSQIFSPSIFRALRPVEGRLFASAHDFALVCPNLGYSNYQKHGAECPLRPLGAACLATHCDRRSYLHKLWRVARSIERRRAIDLAASGALVGIIHADMTEFFTRGGVPVERLRVVPNPVKPFTTQRVKAELNTDLFFIGRVVAEKGIDLAAEAARLTGRRLRVIGDGDLRASLAQRYPEIVFEGWRSHDEIGALIMQARALIVPSRLPETFTLVAHEAMRSGVPVVAFSDVDCREAAAIGAAIVVPPREAASLATGLRRLDDDGETARISRTAFREAHRFSNTAETWRDHLLGLYAELLARSGPIALADGTSAGRLAPHPTGAFS